MERGNIIYEGKGKIMYETSVPDLCLMHFKDEATAFNGKKKGIIKDKGIYNAKITALFYRILTEIGIKNHFVEAYNDRMLIVKRIDIIPVEFVVRNVVAGSLSDRLGIKEGLQLLEPVLETYYKDDNLGDPFVNEAHLRILGTATEEELRICKTVSLQVNLVVKNYLARRGLLLVDFKLEFGRYNNEIYLGDEISPDTSRIWDVATQKVLDKDRFRRDLGEIETSYKEVTERILGGETECGQPI